MFLASLLELSPESEPCAAQGSEDCDLSQSAADAHVAANVKIPADSTEPELQVIFNS